MTHWIAVLGFAAFCALLYGLQRLAGGELHVGCGGGGQGCEGCDGQGAADCEARAGGGQPTE